MAGMDVGHQGTSAHGSSSCDQEQREEGEEAPGRGRFTHPPQEGSEEQKENQRDQMLLYHITLKLCSQLSEQLQQRV